MSRTLTYRSGRVSVTMSGPLHDAVARLLDSDTYRPILAAMDEEMQGIVTTARASWPVGRGVLRFKQEVAAGSLAGARAATGATAAGKTHSRDRFAIKHEVRDDALRVVATNEVPYVGNIRSWKIGMSPSQVQQVLDVARTKQRATITGRNELLRQWYAARGDHKRGKGPDPGKFEAWLGGGPAAKLPPLWTYIDLPRVSPVQVLLRAPQKAAADRLASSIGPMLRQIVEAAGG